MWTASFNGLGPGLISFLIIETQRESAEHGYSPLLLPD